jgi:hypothetical protein
LHGLAASEEVNASRFKQKSRHPARVGGFFLLKATLNKPSIFLSQTCVTLIFEFCGPMRSPFGPFAGP